MCNGNYLFSSFPPSHKLLEQMEGKNSNLKEELVTLKEAYNKAVLEKEVLEQEKAEISEFKSCLIPHRTKAGCMCSCMKE